MPTYLVKIRQEREWEGPVEAPNAEVAAEIARMVIRDQGDIIDQQEIVEEITGTVLEAVN